LDSRNLFISLSNKWMLP